MSGATSRARDRRVVTVLFADIVGSTALIEDTDAEAAAELLAPALASMAASVRDCGGTVINRAGDGILAIFGVPAVAEDHARRACQAALELQAAIASDMKRSEADLRVRVGVSSGRVLVSSIENDAGDIVSYDATGSIVHLASRIETSAQPGTVSVSQATCWLARDRFEFLPLGPVELKGFQRPHLLFRLLGQKAQPNESTGQPARTGGVGALQRAPLVGREAEVAAIGRFFGHLAAAGTGGLLLVTGDAGIGKTRLIEETRPLLPPSVVYLEGHALSFGQRLSYWPFISMLKPLFGIEGSGSPAETWTALEHKLAALFPAERDEILPYLATLLGIEVPPPLSERVRYLDGETLARQVLRAGYRLFERLAQDAPVILVVDDAHWLDGSSAALLEHLLPLAAERKLLLCALGRGGEAAISRLREQGGSALPPQGFAEINLASLSVTESQNLITALLHGDPGNIGRIRDQVLYRASGNPFYIEEIIRALVDAGTIVRGPHGGWTARHQHPLTIPDTIQGVIMARIDRLDERLKDVLGVAAVIGRRFFYRVLRAIADQQDQLDERLALLKGVELIDDDEIAPEITYIFRHALVQESIYESLLLDRRRRLHGRVAAHIEALFPANSQEFASVLALHYARAGQAEKAVQYLVEAAEQATRMAGDDEALLHYEEALDTLARARVPSWNRAQQAGVERRLAEIYLRRGDPDRARQHLDAALAQYGDSLPAGKGGVRRAIALELAWHLAQRAIPRTGLLAFRPRSAAEAEVYADLHELMCWMFLFSDHELLLLATLRTANRSRQISRPGLITKSTSMLGYVLNTLGAHRAAAAYHRRAVEEADRTGHLAAIGLASDVMALHLLHTGRWAEAMEQFDRAREHAGAAGDLHTWSSATVLRCELLCEFGEFEQVLAGADEMAAIGREAAFGPATRWAGVARGKALQRLGRRGEAREAFEQSIDLSVRARDFLNLSVAQGELGRCLLDGDQLDGGMAVLRSGWHAAEAQKLRGHTTVWLTVGLAEGAVKMGERAGTRTALAEAGRACRTALAAGHRFRMGLVQALRARGALEQLRDRDAAARQWWERAAAEAEALGAGFERALCLLEAGTRLGDPAQRDAGRAMLSAFGRDDVSVQGSADRRASPDADGA